jgi:hypothetical protein
MSKKYDGGNYGFKSISVKPDGVYSEKLDCHLRSIYEEVKPENKSLLGKTSDWTETLSQTKSGVNILRLVEMSKEINQALYEILFHELDFVNQKDAIKDIK